MKIKESCKMTWKIYEVLIICKNKLIMKIKHHVEVNESYE